MEKTKMFYFVFLIFLTGCYNPEFINYLENKTLEGPFEVLKVVDGDTIKINYNGKETTVRMIGIDTPEVVDPRKEVQCYGPEASEKAKSLLENKSVFLEFDQLQQKYDKYNRLLAYVYVDGFMYNEYMLKNGYAREYTYDKRYKYYIAFKQAEFDAKLDKLGLWGECNA